MEYIALEVWKEARVLANAVYQVLKTFYKSNLYRLSSQHRCTVLIPSNIEVGYGRKTSADTIQFLQLSRDSLYELETQLYLAQRQNYFGKEELDLLSKQILKCNKFMNGFIKYYKKN